eukprot:NODE_414_length_7911_cov_0.926011.p4 type:complete len:286 gc:universal NODE_414_length_7911_cov_0.926011:6646-5789(-)
MGQLSGPFQNDQIAIKLLNNIHINGPISIGKCTINNHIIYAFAVPGKEMPIKWREICKELTLAVNYDAMHILIYDLRWESVPVTPLMDLHYSMRDLLIEEIAMRSSQYYSKLLQYMTSNPIESNSFQLIYYLFAGFSILCYLWLIFTSYFININLFDRFVHQFDKIYMKYQYSPKMSRIMEYLQLDHKMIYCPQLAQHYQEIMDLQLTVKEYKEYMISHIHSKHSGIYEYFINYYATDGELNLMCGLYTYLSQLDMKMTAYEWMTINMDQTSHHFDEIGNQLLNK